MRLKEVFFKTYLKYEPLLRWDGINRQRGTQSKGKLNNKINWRHVLRILLVTLCLSQLFTDKEQIKQS